MKEKKDFLGISWIALALIFLFNPNLHLIDPLPDAIGYLFLCKAFSKIAALSDEIESAVSLFRKMILIDAAKWLALFVTFSMSASGEKNSSLLLWTFVFAILELLLLIPAYIKLFDGITKLGYFHSNTAILGKLKKEKSVTDRAKKATICFISSKAFFTVLPEFADLSNTSYQEGSPFISIYRYIGLLRGFSIFVVLILGIIWLFRMQKYFLQLRRDTVLMTSLTEAYRTNVSPKVGRFIEQGFRLSYVFFLLALIFSMDYRLDDVTVFPDALSALAIFFAFLSLSRHIKIKKAPWITASALYFIVAIVSHRFEQEFFLQYSYQSIIKNDTALSLYATYTICNIIKVLVFLFCLCLFVHALRKTIFTHTGIEVGRERIDDRTIEMEKALHKELCRPLIFAMVASVIYGISDICYDIFAPMLSGIYVNEASIYGTFNNIQDHYGWIKTLNLVVLFICVLLFVQALNSILSEIREKYRLE